MPGSSESSGVRSQNKPNILTPDSWCHMTIPIIELREIGKQFPGVRALDGVSFDVPSGEVHALLGENGAGKSTLIKIMTGVYQPYHGEILLDGRPIRIGSPVAAQEHGIAAIYQEPMMYPDLSVAENIFITHSGRGPVV